MKGTIKSPLERIRNYKTCTVPGCSKPSRYSLICQMHQRRMKRNGHYGRQHRPDRRADGDGGITAAGYVIHNNGGNRRYEHILIAERILGRRLPDGAQIHHVDGNPSNNANSNLVICPDDAYHKLLHRRQRAMDSCGNPNWEKCTYCKSWDDPLNMSIRKNGRAVHLACERSHDRKRRSIPKAA